MSKNKDTDFNTTLQLVLTLKRGAIDRLFGSDLISLEGMFEFGLISEGIPVLNID